MNIMNLIMIEIPSICHHMVIVDIRENIKQILEETSFFIEFKAHLIELAKKNRNNSDDDLKNSKYNFKCKGKASP